MSQLVSQGESSAADEVELNLARQIQSTFVTGRCHGWPGTRIAAGRIAGASPGGDFHDVIRGCDERYSLVVGTIKGPRLFAALATAVLSSAVRGFGLTSRSPSDLLDHLNTLLSRISADLRDPSVTCSVFHGLVDRARGTLEYCNAGCCRAAVWTQGGEFCELGSTSPALGVMSSALGRPAGVNYDRESLDFASVQRLIIHTDGLTSACSASGESFGVDRGRCLLMDTVRTTADDQVQAILQAVRDHIGPERALTEDVTLFVADNTESIAARPVDSMKTWLQTYERAIGAVPDSSVFLG